MNNKKLILHIGCEKTGTKSIQAALHSNRKRLAEAGILYPKSLGALNHTNLVIAAQDDDVFDNIKSHTLSKMAVTTDGFREYLKDKVRQELGSNVPWHTLILSTELIHSRLHTPDEIARMFELIKEYVSEIEIVLFLRRQDDLAISRFSTMLRAGHKNFNDVFSNIGASAYKSLPLNRSINDYEDYYDYKKLIERFQPHVPKENIKLFLYNDSVDALCSVEEFASLSGVPIRLLHNDRRSFNAAMSAKAQYVISQVNQARAPYYPSGFRNEKIRQLHLRIEKELPGEIRQTSRADAEDFFLRFESSNEWVRKNFFPEREALFSGDFSKYPAEIDYSDFPSQLAGEVTKFVEIANSYSLNETFQVRLQRIKNQLRKHPRYGRLMKLGGRCKYAEYKVYRVAAGLLKRLRKWLSTQRGKLLNRQLKLRNKIELLTSRSKQAAILEDPKRNVLSKNLLVRILGNDHPPRHCEKQTINNLKFILDNEPAFSNCRKLFVLNRIVDTKREQELIDLLEQHSMSYIRIPFVPQEYAKIRCETGFLAKSKSFLNVSDGRRKKLLIRAMIPKIIYVMNINSARNLAIEEGRKSAIWTFVLDGNCVLTQGDYDKLDKDCDASPHMPYLVIPMVRYFDNKEFFQNSGASGLGVEEPQIAFHCSAQETYNETLPYGFVDKAALLKRLGVPGLWQQWGGESWLKLPADISRERYCYRISKSKVGRLSSGRSVGVKSAQASRYKSRLDGIIRTIQSLDAEYGTVEKEISEFLCIKQDVD